MASHDPARITTPPVGPPVVAANDATSGPLRDDHVVVSFEGPLPQNRLTVAFRVILAIPHFAWSYLLNIAYNVVLVIAWFVALFTGRVPQSLTDVLAFYVRYQARLYGYLLFLTDRYPPFEDERGETYAVNVAFSPGPLSRPAVLFRIFLLVPGMIVTGLVGIGVALVSPVAWLLTLIMGRLPTPLWEAHAASIRYSTQFVGFASLLSAEQPSKLFGDKPTSLGADDPPAVPELTAQPMIRTLVLSQAAKRLLVLFMVAAALVWVGIVSITAIVGTRLVGAYEELDESYLELAEANDVHGEGVQSCAVSGGGIACLRPVDGALADAFDEFGEDLADIEWPSNLQPDDLLAATRDCAEALRAMSAAESEASYNAATEVYREAEADFLDEYDFFAGELEFE